MIAAAAVSTAAKPAMPAAAGNFDMARAVSSTDKSSVFVGRENLDTQFYTHLEILPTYR